MIAFSDIEDAYLFVSSAPYGMNSAILRENTGEILYRSEMTGVDEIGDDDNDWETCVEIPHKNDLDMGRPLVVDFVDTHLPDEYDHVQRMFRRPGAYGRFKSLLESKGLLDTWHQFEDEAQEKALRQWCEENEIELADEDEVRGTGA